MQFRLDLESEGFAQVHKSINEMLEQLANEPSVGLFYIQQHVQNAVPNLHKIKTQVTDTTQGVYICTEDMKDALTSIKLMQECGPPVVERMVKNLTSSISLLSTKQQNSGPPQTKSRHQTQPQFSTKDSNVLTAIGSAFQKASSVSWKTHDSDVKQSERNAAGGTSARFVPSVLKSAFQRAGSFAWSARSSENSSPRILKETLSSKDLHTSEISTRASHNGTALFESAAETGNGGEVLPLSINVNPDGNDFTEPESLLNTIHSDSHNQLIESKSNFEQFQADCAAKFEAWLHEDYDHTPA